MRLRPARRASVQVRTISVIALFALADEERVEEGVHRLRVEAGGAAGDDQRLIRAIRGAQRDAGQIERGEHVGVELFVGQAEPEHVEIGQRMAGLQTVERKTHLAHRRLHVHPRRVGALGQHVGLCIDAVVQDRHTQIRHAQIVDIREDQRQPIRCGIPVFDHAVILAAGVTCGLLDERQDAVEGARDGVRGDHSLLLLPGLAKTGAGLEPALKVVLFKVGFRCESLRTNDEPSVATSLTNKASQDRRWQTRPNGPAT